MTDQLKAMGDRLRSVREESGLTQARAANQAGIDASSLSRYERGEVPNPSMTTVADLAKIYGARIDWIVTGEGPKQSGAEARVEYDANQGYPGIEAYIESHPELSPEYAEELRGLRRSGGPDQITYEVVDHHHRGMLARDRGKAPRRPRLVE